ncbi:MAG: type II secretion system protein [Elusimicrobiaceae bacterium]|nr:type II secretion system protein [Elusimicrobiaceae bacterium]
MKKNNKKKGFTLIEILVAVMIIGVLAAIALPSYMRSVERSRAAGPIANLGSIAKAQNAHKLATAHYTDEIELLDISLKDESTNEVATGNTFESEYFTYKVYGDEKEVAIATRKNVAEDKKYELSVDYNTNKIYCRPIENKTCIDLGLEEGQDYGPADEIPWDDCVGGQLIVTSCYTRDNNGIRETSVCNYSAWISGKPSGNINCSMSYEEYDEEGNTTSITYKNCAASDSVNGFCQSYNSMEQYDGEGQKRDCYEISGDECNLWGDWYY